MGAVLLINASGVETRVALVEDGTISEYYLERNKDKGIVGNIYKGKVVRVLPGMQAAFVDIGLDKAAFLYVNDVFYDPDFSEQQFELTEGEHAEYEDDEEDDPRHSHGHHHGHIHSEDEAADDDSDEDSDSSDEQLTIMAPKLSAAADTEADDAGETAELAADEAAERTEVPVPAAPEADNAERADDDGERHGELKAKGGRRKRNRGSPHEVRLSEATPTEASLNGDGADAEAAPGSQTAAKEPQMPDAKADLAAEETASPAEAPAADNLAEAVEAANGHAAEVSSEEQPPSSEKAEEVSEKSAEAASDGGEQNADAPVAEDSPTPASESDDEAASTPTPAPTPTPTPTPVDEPTPQQHREKEKRHHKGDKGAKKGGRDKGSDEREKAQKRHAAANIQDILKVGQEIIVQVAKDPIGTKGARVTSHISIPGRQIVFMPTVDHVGISRRIEKESERRRLRDIVERIRPAGTGFIVRTVAENISTEKLEADARFLIGIWSEVVAKKDKVSAPALLHPDLDLTLRATRDLFVQDVEKLVIDDRAEWERISRFVAAQAPALKDRVVLHDSDEPIFEAYGIEDELKRAYSRKVWLKSGGYLIIDQAEALTAIDVNSGRYVGKKSLEETITKINIEAAKEIVYQLRLRNIGGIMIIDFIDMAKPQNRDKVFKALQEALSKDKARTNILKISELGLIEMTRKRVRESVGRTLNEPCPYCDGRGFLKSRETVAYEIFRQIRSTAYLYTDCSINVNCHPDVARILTVDERDELRYLMNRFNKSIYVHPQPGYHQEQVEIYGKQERPGRGRNGDRRSSNGGQLRVPEASDEMKPASTPLAPPQGRLSEYGSNGEKN